MVSRDSEHFSRKLELGQFLRSRRERTAPTERMVASHPRRRTPGLRREEVADAAGVSLSWYTWLEQGRDINVSPEALRRVSRALLLEQHEVAHVFRLAGLGLPEEAPPLPITVNPSLQRLLDAMVYIPSYVHNSRWDRIAWNDASLALMGDFSKDPFEERNTVWRTFLNPEVRGYTEDWSSLAQIVVAEFNSSYGRQFEDPWLKQFVEGLAAMSPEFQELWELRAVLPRQVKPTCINHTSAGRFYLERSVFAIPSEQNLSLVVFTPLAREDSARRMVALVDDFRATRQR